jgi:transaldolase / glucose-6-phosphate isomerase
VSRLWRREPALWPQAPASDVRTRLGWLLAPEQSASRIAELTGFAEQVAADGFEHVVLLGMGGSSLAAGVLSQIVPGRPDRPRLSVLDSTHPQAVRDCLDRAPVARTLYLVSSKSGTTLEPNAFFRFFWEKAARLPGETGRRFVAITDPGTSLEALARARRFRACFGGPTDVGGRYSALTVFGLVPAALFGADLAALLSSARAMVARCSEKTDLERNPGLRLGAALGELARAGRDKLVFLTSETMRAFPAWAEQLVAESLGKIGRGIVPVATSPPPSELSHGTDVVYAYLQREGEDDRPNAQALEAAAAAGVPVLRFRLASPTDLGREFFRWELAIAACGELLEVDPFDQPDVEHAKDLARQAMDPRAPTPADDRSYGAYLGPTGRETPELRRWLESVRPGDYLAIQAFLAPGPATDAALASVASKLRARFGTVVTIGYGPRFLHSTGQLHKGGPPSGAFLQLVDEPRDDLAVPEMGLSFGGIVRAQARGDRGALEEKHRRLVVLNVGSEPSQVLGELASRLGSVPGA